MQNINALELVGYLASALVAASMLLTSILKLRVVNLIGSTVFAIYGLLIHAYPVALVNLFIACVNAVHVMRMMRTREFFTIVHVAPDSDYLHYFLDRNLADIRKSMPDFSYNALPGQLIVFVVRDLQPAGLLIGEVNHEGTLLVQLDYVIPGYRDLKIGRYLLEERKDFFQQHGVKTIVTAPGTALHRAYLQRMGFVREKSDRYARRVGWTITGGAQRGESVKADLRTSGNRKRLSGRAPAAPGLLHPPHDGADEHQDDDYADDDAD